MTTFVFCLGQDCPRFSGGSFPVKEAGFPHDRCLEGQHNALGDFGYNRDGKRGKLQIVVGLLEVRPVWVRKESRTRGHVFCCLS